MSSGARSGNGGPRSTGVARGADVAKASIHRSSRGRTAAAKVARGTGRTRAGHVEGGAKVARSTLATRRDGGQPPTVPVRRSRKVGGEGEGSCGPEYSG